MSASNTIDWYVDHFGSVAEQGTAAFVKRACLLAACGWDACQLSSTSNPNRHSIAALPPGTCDMQQSVLSCSMCGARAGLWSFAQLPGQYHAPSLSLSASESWRQAPHFETAFQHTHQMIAIHTVIGCNLVATDDMCLIFVAAGALHSRMPDVWGVGVCGQKTSPVSSCAADTCQLPPGIICEPSDVCKQVKQVNC